MTNPDIYLKDKKNTSVPKLLYRGTINPNDKAGPLSHVGSFKAARERLDSLERAIKEGRSENLTRLGVDFSKVFFQIKPILLKIKNPFRLPELGNHKLQDYKRLMVHVLLMKEKGRDVVSSLYAGKFGSDYFASNLIKHSLPKEYTYIFDDPYSLNFDDVKKELMLGGLFEVEKGSKDCVNSINRENLCYQRMIRFFERQGYDGFVYRNGWEDVGEDSYICFRPDTVIEPLKVDNKELVIPTRIDKQNILLLDEEKKIAACQEKTLLRSEAVKFFDIEMRFHYGKQLDWLTYCMKKAHRSFCKLAHVVIRRYCQKTMDI